MHCPTCRQKAPLADIAFVDARRTAAKEAGSRSSEQHEEEKLHVRGSYSTKVRAGLPDLRHDLGKAHVATHRRAFPPSRQELHSTHPGNTLHEGVLLMPRTMPRGTGCTYSNCVGNPF